MLWHAFLAVNGKRKEVVTEGKKLAAQGTKHPQGNPSKGE